MRFMFLIKKPLINIQIEKPVWKSVESNKNSKDQILNKFSKKKESNRTIRKWISISEKIFI